MESRRAERVFQRILKWLQNHRHRLRRSISLPLARNNPGDIFLTVSNHRHLDDDIMFSKIINDFDVRIIGFCHDVFTVHFPEYFWVSMKGLIVSYFTALTESSSLLLCNSVCTKAIF